MNRSLTLTAGLLLLLGQAAAQAPLAPAAGAGDRRTSSWRWQRTITPPPGAPQAEQCVVLDADVLSRAAPGMRDVRLLQDGREIAFATDESFDERQGDSGPAPPDDRALFDTVGSSPTRLVESPAGQEPVREATFLLRAHVPVERIRLLTSGGRPVHTVVHVELVAQPLRSRMGEPAEPERVPLEAEGERLALPVTLGANLQEDTEVTVRLVGAPSQVYAVGFEMRRRELCYQPLSSSPLTLFFGNALARPVRYDFASHYHPSATPLLATLGETQANPAYRLPAERTKAKHLQRLLLVAGAALAALLLLLTLTLGLLLRVRKAR